MLFPWNLNALLCAPRAAALTTPSAFIAVILIAMLVYCNDAHAATLDSNAPAFFFSGFGTLGLVHSSENQADFTANLFQPNGAGYTHAWSSDVDSRVGAQVTANFTPKISAMLQVISELNADRTYAPHVEWANVKYQPVPEFSVRLGRIVLPTFLASDSLKVGFSNPWVRPPVEVYNLVPVTSHDGIDSTYTMHLGRVANMLTGAYGINNADDPRGGKNKTRRQLSISDTVEFGAATIHITYQTSILTIDSINALIDAFRQFGPQGAAIAEAYGDKDKRQWFVGIGAMYDPGDWFLTGEWGVADFHSVLGKRTGWYLSAGHRWARLTPYLTYAQTKGENITSDSGLTVSGLPSALAAEAMGLNGALNSFLKSIPVQKTVSAGARWDLANNVDFKAQYNRIRLGPGSPGTLDNLQPNFRPGGTVSLFSLAVDFVF